MGHRREQLESSLQRTISEVIAAGLGDPRISGLITVTQVKVSPDGHQAFVGISVLPEEKQKLAVHGLRSAAGHIQTEVLGRLRTRAIPHLEFREDDSLKKQAAILGAIAEVVKPAEPDADQAAKEPPPPLKEDEQN